MRRTLPLALLALLAGPAPAAALSFSDAFAGGSLDPFYWEASSSNGSSVDASTGKIIVTQMGGAGVTSIGASPHPNAITIGAAIHGAISSMVAPRQIH